MATVACPTCGLPRAKELLDTVACPLCGMLGRVTPASVAPEPVHDRAWVIPEPQRQPVAPVKSRFVSGSLFGFAAGIAVAFGGVLAWPAINAWIHSANANPEVVGNDPVVNPGPPMVAVAPLPREVATAYRVSRPPIVPPTDEQRVELIPPQEAIAAPAPEPAPRNPFRPEAPRALVLDRAQHYSPRVAPGSTVTIRGWVKTLIVRDLEAGAVLDCAELEAQEVIVIGKVDGGSRLTLRAPGGSIIFRAKIDGAAKLDLRAPGGTVTFETPTGMGRDGSKIDGGSSVDVTARAVSFLGRISGAGTKVAVTLTSNGSLAFTEIEGSARLEYTKTDPDDADPAISRGRIGGMATFTKVE